ncbi:MAG: transcription elongation factor GreA [Dehalococcoidia bacterium]
MADDFDPPATNLTLAEALDQYLTSLKNEQRRTQEQYIRHFVKSTGEEKVLTYLTGSRVELYAEREIKSSDPNAQERVQALKSWFQFLKKREYTGSNYGIHIRVRKVAGRSVATANRGGTRTEEPPVEMTAEGIDQLKVDVTRLRDEREETVHAVEVARADGDLRENAPYHAARERLAFIDSKLKSLEETLKRAVVVERTAGDERSVVGSTVSVTRADNGSSQTYQLVGAREADARQNRISVESPVGRQLLGRVAGETVAVELPNGNSIEYRIDDVKHA